MIVLRGLVQPLVEKRTLKEQANLVESMRLANEPDGPVAHDLTLGVAAEVLQQHQTSSASR
jgi:hypothetical protein